MPGYIQWLRRGFVIRVGPRCFKPGDPYDWAASGEAESEIAACEVLGAIRSPKASHWRGTVRALQAAGFDTAGYERRNEDGTIADVIVIDTATGRRHMGNDKSKGKKLGHDDLKGIALATGKHAEAHAAHVLELGNAAMAQPRGRERNRVIVEGTIAHLIDLLDAGKVAEARAELKAARGNVEQTLDMIDA